MPLVREAPAQADITPPPSEWERERKWIELSKGLYWAPHEDQPSNSRDDEYWFCVEQEKTLNYGKTVIMHYETVPQKHAPPTIDIIVEYGRLIAEKVKKYERVIHYGDCWRTNLDNATDASGFGAILAGYILLLDRVPFRQILAKLSQHVQKAFPVTWSEATGRHACCVADCLLGLQFAMTANWVEAKHFDRTNATMDLFKMDCSVIVPGKMLVLADPVTTLMESNVTGAVTMRPAEVEVDTANSWSTAADADEQTHASVETRKPSKLMERRNKDGNGLTITIPPRVPTTVVRKPSQVSPLSPTKMERRQNSRQSSKDKHSDPWDFTTFFQRNDVRLIARCNFLNEEGLSSLGGSYDKSEFSPFAKLLDVPFPDYNGGVPTKTIVRQFFEAQKNVTGCIAIHCKSGFGRSIVMAALLLMYRYKFPGRAALGWCRLCRGGAITTPFQETYLSQVGKIGVVDYFYTKRCHCVIM